MPNEVLIAEIENMLAEIVTLGGKNERSQIVPNLTVQDANPTGLTGFVIVSDNRDGDNILAKKVGSVIYNNNDLVNVMFVEGAEAIAFQQGSESANNGIWEIVPSTSTDIYYDKGDVGIGKSVAPDAALEVLDTSQAQMRLTFQEDTKFADFEVDTNHDLSIDPSSTGLVRLATSTMIVKQSNATVGINTSTTQFTEEGSVAPAQLFLLRVNTGGFRGAVFAVETDTPGRNAQNAFLKARAGPAAVADDDRIGDFFWSGHDGTDYNRSARFGAIVDGSVSANTVPMALTFSTSTTNSGGLTERFRIASNGDIFIKSSNQDYLLTVESSSVLALQGQSASSASNLGMYTNDGDGTDNIGLLMYLVGTPGSIANRERLLIQGFAGSQFRIQSEANGTGTLRPLVLETEGNTSQVHLATDGNVGIGVSVPSTALDIGAGAIELNEMTAPGGGAANTARLYAVDNGAGKTQLVVVFNTGAAQVLATQP